MLRTVVSIMCGGSAGKLRYDQAMVSANVANADTEFAQQPIYLEAGKSAIQSRSLEQCQNPLSQIMYISSKFPKTLQKLTINPTSSVPIAMDPAEI